MAIPNKIFHKVMFFSEKFFIFTLNFVFYKSRTH